MNNYIFAFVFSFYLGGTIVWFYMRATFANTKVDRTEFDRLNSSYRNSIEENVKLEERISIMQERVEELSEKLLKAEEELSIADGAKNSIRSMNEILYDKLKAQETQIENLSGEFEKKQRSKI